MDTITYAAGNWVVQTTDDGVTWAVIAIPPADSQWLFISLANIGGLLFGVDDLSGVMRSTDHGTTWDTASTGLPPGNVICVAGIGSQLFAGTYNGYVFVSKDSARTWNLSSTGLPTGADLSFVVSNGAVLLSGYQGPGIFLSSDTGKTWSEVNQGLTNSKVVAITSVADTTIVGTDGGVFLTTDDGATWLPRQIGLINHSVSSLLIDGENLYAGADRYSKHTLAFSTDRGGSWDYPDSGLSVYGINALIHSGQNLVACGEPTDAKYGLYRSTNGGRTWSVSNVNSRWDACDVSGLVKIGSTLIASTNSSPYVSNDDGLTWSVSENGFNYTNQIVVSSIGSVGSKAFIHCTTLEWGNLGVYISDDFGNSWHPTLDRAFPPRRRVTCFASIGENLFAGTDSDGIFLSTDYGTSWTSMTSNLGDSTVISLSVHRAELLAGTASSGVWRRPMGQFAVSPTASVSYSVNSFPNPISQSTTIHFASPESSPVQVIIVNLLGTEVERLFDGELDAGEHSFTWDAKGHAGMYWCEVRMDGRAPERVGMMVVK